MSANAHLVDTPIRLGQCNRCEQYVFLAMSSGVKSAADVAAADRDAYIAAVIAGRRSFDLLEQAGRPHKLLTRRLGSPAPLFDPEGAQAGAEGRRRVLVEHGCGGRAQNMVTFREVEQGPPQAPVTRGAHRGGSHREPVHASGLYVEELPRPSRVGRANRRLSESTPRCDVCSEYIRDGEMYWGIQLGAEWKYAAHEECE
ncbi:hypothetical protein ACFY7C_19475 [Streptomyces sp. NPDC012769]|uniref:hypothetical protein n=1 Tax=Streptomyces sp. NPDC012769 TaxID=3364848 RepID=UPI00369BBDBE